MITTIGIISGEILDLLDRGNGVFVLGEIQSGLNGRHDLVLMSLGWLLKRGYVRILEDPLRTSLKNVEPKTNLSVSVSMFDLVVDQRMMRVSRARIKELSCDIDVISDKIMTLLDGVGTLVSLQTIEQNLNEQRNLILMGLGWLVREGHVLAVAVTNDMMVFGLAKPLGLPRQLQLDNEQLAVI